MLEIRLFEERVQELFTEGLIQGTTHLCQGQEAVSVGAVAALKGQDYLTTTYRGHGHALARGMPMQDAFAELMGRETGCCRGMGGSMHLTDFSRGLIGAFAIVGAGLPVALGAAISASLQHRDAVAMTFVGDGGTNIGSFHETLNMGAVWKAPLVVIVENNLYGEYSPLATTTAVTDLARRAEAHGIPGVIVDGQDVVAVHGVASEAVERARRGEGPTLIEAKTYRFRGHSRSDPASYRPAGELEAWLERDPIEILAAGLMRDGALTAEELAEIRGQLQQEVDLAAGQAAEGAFPSMESLRTYVYAR
jgi:pyruvate dehydrogenase E1 component alpha subunit